MMKNKGSLVISLDYEMMWGCREWSSPDNYGQSNVAKVPEVITGIMSLFRKYNIHSTFATVGMIMLKNKDEALVMVPKHTPSYTNKNASPYNNDYLSNIKSKDEHLFFDIAQIQTLKAEKSIEIATHTFSHYYCWEPGQTLEEFESDIKNAVDIANKQGIQVKSIVFPKNMISPNYLKICLKYGITSYRGNSLKYFDKTDNRLEAIKNRIFRLVDAYINIGGPTTVPYNEIPDGLGLYNIRASRMLRPYCRRLAFLEELRFRRIKKELIYAAQNGEMYHLWWHPHNFGANIKENLQFLERILKVYRDCHTKYGMQSLTMNELYEQLAK